MPDFQVDVSDEGEWNASMSNAPTPSLTERPSVVDAEVVHDQDADAAFFLNMTLIVCVLLAFYVKKNRMYYLPERYEVNCDAIFCYLHHCVLIQYCWFLKN